MNVLAVSLGRRKKLPWSTRITADAERRDYRRVRPLSGCKDDFRKFGDKEWTRAVQDRSVGGLRPAVDLNRLLLLMMTNNNSNTGAWRAIHRMVKGPTSNRHCIAVHTVWTLMVLETVTRGKRRFLPHNHNLGADLPICSVEVSPIITFRNMR